ncbi:phosphodiester glycosidase family protein [Paenibacillus sp. IB182496]|uniref:Phosphodiester glycosidase family protein n=1 Tax=Paenibacillus sabuli TaxID=2772509 RepID=A0A927GTJ4_9BACL|nr:phosphodiester glycosidase family protein [Paenibacillus sabuli]MBD2847155.1 phosphodiester glycosidase family protein [Paenibacillus sabuli]
MTTPLKLMNRTLLLACAPFLGMLVWLLWAGFSLELGSSAYPEAPPAPASASAELGAPIADKLDASQELANVTADKIRKTAWLYTETGKQMQQLVTLATAQSGRPGRIYDRRITLALGTPSKTVQSDKLRAQLFYVRAQHFKGYALKVKLKEEGAMSMVLGEDRFGGAETTLAAVKRYGAIAGVNAGGFADQRGSRYPLSTTVMDGQYVNGFEPTFSNLFFVGVNKNRKLVGGNYTTQAELDRDEPEFGASFVPILLKDGVSQTIPAKWASSPKRAARTVIANYKDDQLLFLVTDAADESGRSGATLGELQLLLRRFGAQDAYNLDGGGSSSLIFDGRIVNAPSDGRLRKLATHFLFFE